MDPFILYKIIVNFKEQSDTGCRLSGYFVIANNTYIHMNTNVHNLLFLSQTESETGFMKADIEQCMPVPESQIY